MSRPRVGELLAFAGAAIVIVSLFVRNYQNASGDLTAFDTFGPAVVLLIAAAAVALLLFGATLGERSPALPIALAIWTTLIGAIATGAAIVRVFERPEHATRLCIGAWFALAGAVAILAGALLSMRDERTSRHDAPSVEPRPAP
jgi:hypothetical protein